MATVTRRKRYFVAVANVNGTITLFPMKRWLRQHLEYLPDDRDPREWHSRQMAAHLRSLGFHVEEDMICIAAPI